ncbi:MAG: aldo/keto reductase [Sedimentisphaerales bacterium]|nr:aldo/keto reductase [Sedimentisphaerales bacterium]
MAHTEITRRRFIRSTAVLATGAILSSHATAQEAPKPKLPPTACDLVDLGKTGLKISRLGFGTGSIGGSIQRALGQEKFTSLIHYAYGRGITYIDTADSYKTHPMVREAIKSLPREKLFIQSKMPGLPENPLEVIDRYRKELGVDYIDSLLTHCAVAADWDDKRKRVIDALEEAKQKKIIRAHGVSCHSLPASTKAAQFKWVDVNLVRVNPQGAHIDTPAETWDAESNASHLPAVLEQIRIMRKNGHGIIGMKIIGNGDFTKPQDREKSVRFAMQPGLLDAVVIGFKSEGEVDEAIMRINRALAETAKV